MRLPANENFPRDAVEALRKDGHDVSWVRTECPGMSDREVLTKAQDENRDEKEGDIWKGLAAFVEQIQRRQ